MKRTSLLLLILIILLEGCNTIQINVASIRIKGSDTMYHLTNLLAQEYMEQNPGVSIYVDGGGTSSGVRALIKGEIEICTASRNLEPDEIKLLADNFKSIGISFLIAKDGLCVYLNSENPIQNLSQKQVSDIFTCTINNWKELGGPDKEIIRINRTPNSGTYLYFKEHILEGKEYCINASVGITTENIIEQIKNDRYSIGYGGVAFKSDITLARIDNVLPTEENIRNDRYPITRYLHFYTLTQPTGQVKDFIDWVLSPKGQNIIKSNGFIPLFEISY